MSYKITRVGKFRIGNRVCDFYGIPSGTIISFFFDNSTCFWTEQKLTKFYVNIVWDNLPNAIFTFNCESNELKLFNGTNSLWCCMKFIP